MNKQLDDYVWQSILYVFILIAYKVTLILLYRKCKSTSIILATARQQYFMLSVQREGLVLDPIEFGGETLYRDGYLKK